MNRHAFSNSCDVVQLKMCPLTRATTCVDIYKVLSMKTPISRRNDCGDMSNLYTLIVLTMGGALQYGVHKTVVSVLASFSIRRWSVTRRLTYVVHRSVRRLASSISQG